MSNISIQQKEFPIETITAEHIKEKLLTNDDIEYSFSNRDCIVITLKERHYYQYGMLTHFEVYYAEFAPGYTENGQDAWLVSNTQNFPTSAIDEAVACFIARLNSKTPSLNAEAKVYSLDKIASMERKQHVRDSHYQYLDDVIEDFWKDVFQKTLDETHCSGILVAHGDKARGYADLWGKAGIPFNRGALLYLLTYTKELGDTPKHKSGEWVINNYSKYLPFITAAERNATKRVHDIDI